MTPSQSPRQPPLHRWTGPRRHAARIRSLHSLFWSTHLGLPLRDQIIEALWPQAALRVLGQLVGTHGLARLGPAQAYCVPARRGLPEEVIEGHDAVYFRAG